MTTTKRKAGVNAPKTKLTIEQQCNSTDSEDYTPYLKKKCSMIGLSALDKADH